MKAALLLKHLRQQIGYNPCTVNEIRWWYADYMAEGVRSMPIESPSAVMRVLTLLEKKGLVAQMAGGWVALEKEG